MKKIAIATDSNSGLTQERGEDLGIFVLPMPFTINDQLCIEGRTIKHKDFFRLQKEGANIFSSQPSPQDVMDFWDAILEEYDAVIYIPMSSALSGSCATASMLAQDYEGRVFVIDNFRLSATQMQSCIDARTLVDRGADVDEIIEYLNRTADDSVILCAVDDLQYLKKGGRLSPTAASVATLLNMKPILLFGRGPLECVAKPRGMKAARKKMLQMLEAEMESRFHTTDVDDLNLHIAQALPIQDAIEWKDAMESYFHTTCTLDRLPLSLATHTGFGAAGVGMTRKLK